MLGRAVQLTLPAQTAFEEYIEDSISAQSYLQLALHYRTAEPSEKITNEGSELEALREQNRNGSYLWGNIMDHSVATTTTSSATCGDAPRSDEVRFLNLETSVTESINNADVPNKGINYHMHSENLAAVLSRLPTPIVVIMANNHTLDFGRTALLRETLPLCHRLSSGSLAHAAATADESAGGDDECGTRLSFVGIGENWCRAARGVNLFLPNSQTRLSVVAVAAGCSGTPSQWNADNEHAGLLYVPPIISTATANAAFEIIKQSFIENDKYERETGTCSNATSMVRVLSIHWGPNHAQLRRRQDLLHRYGRSGRRDEKTAPPPDNERTARSALAYRVIDELNVDVVYGHSSHHIRGLEIYRGKLIIYGAGT